MKNIARKAAVVLIPLWTVVLMASIGCAFVGTVLNNKTLTCIAVVGMVVCTSPMLVAAIAGIVASSVAAAIALWKAQD